MSAVRREKKTIIVDLDGTLANELHRNHLIKNPPRQWEAYYDRVRDDAPFWDIITMVNEFYDKDYRVVILTGRVERTRVETETWLRKHNVSYHVLKMRGTDDRTQDDELKIRWAFEMGLHDRTLFVLEDRKRVVDAWRRAGFTCLQVADGTF